LGDGARDFDIQHHFTIGGIGRGGIVPGMVHGDGRHFRLWNADFLEKDVQVA